MQETQEQAKQKRAVITRAMVKEATERICEENGLGADFAKDFWEALLMDDAIYKEYVHYLVYQDFACKELVSGYSIVDVLIWQIDHFKAQLDVDTTLTKRREGSMVLLDRKSVV